MTDFEDRLRDTLSTRSEDAHESADLARGARARLRRRRTAMARVVAGATSVVVVSVGIALVGAAVSGDDKSPTPPVTPDVVREIARDPAAREVSSPDDHLQEVAWREISMWVPVEWQRGPTSAWCREGKDPAVLSPRIALPDDPAPRIACTPTSGYGLTVGPAAAFDPAYESGHVWRYDTEGIEGRAQFPDDAWVSSWYDDEWVVTVVTPDPGLTSRIALSIRGDEVDANGCAVAYDELKVRTTPGPRGVGAALCRYSVDGQLEDSTRLTIREVDKALAAIADAPDLPPGDHCVPQQGWILTLTPAGQPAYLALYGTGGLGSCPDGLQSTAAGQTPGGYRELTPDLVKALGLVGLAVD
ncbi:MAG: hypothetical protein ABIR39_15155 [Nocardioides sp.]|uniref:hypothetical protein n=1 Tax=Nocardioides sp. TaxID=35761 RepID=UPI0032658268